MATFEYRDGMIASSLTHEAAEAIRQTPEGRGGRIIETVDERRSRATKAFVVRMFEAWHSARNLECKEMNCEHSWYPA